MSKDKKTIEIISSVSADGIEKFDWQETTAPSENVVSPPQTEGLGSENVVPPLQTEGLDREIDRLKEALKKLEDSAQKSSGGLGGVSKGADKLSDDVKGLSGNSASLTRKFAAVFRSSGLVNTRLTQLTSTGLTLFKSFSVLGAAAKGLGVAFAAVSIAVGAFNKAVQQLTSYSKRFSPEVALADANRQVQEMFDEMEFAQESGSDVADLQNQSTELQRELRELGRDLFNTFSPLLKTMGFTLNLILDLLDAVLTPMLWILRQIFDILSAVFNFLLSIIEQIPFIGQAAKKYLDQSDDDAKDLDTPLRDLFSQDNIGLDQAVKKSLDKLIPGAENRGN